MKKLIFLLFIIFGAKITFAQVNNGAYVDTTVTNFFHRTSGMTAADGGYTIPLNDERVMWLFGDSNIDDYDPTTKTVACAFQANNSILLQPKNNWDPAQTKTLPGSEGSLSFFKPKPKSFVWPLTGFQHGDTIYIICINLHKFGPGQYDLANEGDSWAKIPVSTMKVAGYIPLQKLNDIGFGQGFIKDNGYIYTYGSQKNKVFAARFHENNPYEKWTFWDGNAWVYDVKKADSIADVPGFSMYICKVKNKYVLLSTEFSLACDNGKDIYAATSPNPYGPFTKRKVIYTIPNDKQGHRPFFYGPLAHPEYINDKDELLIDYSINGYLPCFPSTCATGRYDPNNYRPRAIRVPLKLIDPDL